MQNNIKRVVVLISNFIQYITINTINVEKNTHSIIVYNNDSLWEFNFN